MELDTLRLFAEVAQVNSFAEVARHREMEPSSISRAVAGLEAELGARLFQRTTRAMTLTDVGATYLARLLPILAELDRAQDELSSTDASPTGLVRLTTSVAFGQLRVVPLLLAFRTALPRLNLELVLTDANLDLVSERIDMALRLGPSYRADVIGVRLFRTRYSVVASPNYLALHEAPKHPADLTHHSCLLFPLANFRSRWQFRLMGAAEIQEVAIQGDLTMTNALAIRDAAISGLGPALIAQWAISDALADGRLIDMFPDYEVCATSFDTAAWLLYPSRGHLPHRVRKAVDFFRGHLTS